MKSVLLIGLGKFGQTLGNKLINMGDEVMIVDKNEDVINTLAPKYSNALIANCMNADTLKSMDIPAFDVCIVAIGDDFQSSLEITSHLKDLGAKYIISKATTEIQKKFLLRSGADEVIYPDLDIAEKVAIKLNSTAVFDYIEIDSVYSIFTIDIPKDWLKKRLIDVNPRKKYGLNILTIKRDKQVIESPNADYVFKPGDHIVVFGNTEEILAFTNSNQKKRK